VCSRSHLLPDQKIQKFQLEYNIPFTKSAPGNEINYEIIAGCTFKIYGPVSKNTMH